MLSSCQSPDPRQDASSAAVEEASPGIAPGICQDNTWYFANRSGPQATALRKNVAPYGFMPLEDKNAVQESPVETALSPFLLDVEPAIHLQVEKVGLRRQSNGLLVSAWSAERKLAEQRIKLARVSCLDGKLTAQLPGDWRYAFGSPGHASFSLELALAPGGELVLRSFYRSWTAVFLVIPVMSTSDREIRFSAVDIPSAMELPQVTAAAKPADCSAVAGLYSAVGSYLTAPGNRNDTELKSVNFQELLPFASETTAPGMEVSSPSLVAEFQASKGLTLTILNSGETPLVSRVETTRIRCRHGTLEFGMHGNFDPAATFWLAGIAYGRLKLRLWRDDFGGLMVEAREITDGTVLVVLPIYHRESTWFRFPGFDNEVL